MSRIHPTAVIDPRAELHPSVRVGAYCVIGPEVFIDEDCELYSHVVIESHTRIGKRNRIYPFASLGAAPQDKKYQGEATFLEIGDDNCIREFVTFNRGTVQDGGVTRLGHRNWIMANVHLAHDCIVGDDTVFANNASLAGHVHIADKVVLGGYALVYQFVHIGELAMVAFSSGVKQNVPPYALIEGMPAQYKSINVEGLKRQGWSAAEIQAVKEAHHVLYHQGLRLDEARAALQSRSLESASVAKILAFLADTGKRGLIR